MLTELLALSVCLAAAPGIAVGAGADRSVLAARIFRALYWTGLPLAAIQLAGSPFRSAGPAAALAFLALLALLPVAAAYARRRFADPGERTAFTLSVYWGNVGWLGLPVAVAVFGTDALPAAILYQSVAAAPQHYAFGTTLSAWGGEGGRRRGWGQALLRNPYLPVTLAALVWAGLSLPRHDVVLDVSAWLLIAQSVPAFFAFGLLLARLPLTPDRDLVAALVGRMVVSPLLLAPAALLVTVPRPFFLQAAAACGITPLALAAEHRLPTTRLAPAIAWSNALVILGVAAWLALRAAAGVPPP